MVVDLELKEKIWNFKFSKVDYDCWNWKSRNFNNDFKLFVVAWMKLVLNDERWLVVLKSVASWIWNVFQNCYLIDVVVLFMRRRKENVMIKLNFTRLLVWRVMIEVLVEEKKLVVEIEFFNRTSMTVDSKASMDVGRAELEIEIDSVVLIGDDRTRTDDGVRRVGWEVELRVEIVFLKWTLVASIWRRPLTLAEQNFKFQLILWFWLATTLNVFKYGWCLKWWLKWAIVCWNWIFKLNLDDYWLLLMLVEENLKSKLILWFWLTMLWNELIVWRMCGAVVEK